MAAAICTTIYGVLMSAGVFKFGWISFVCVLLLFMYYVKKWRDRMPGGYLSLGSIVSCCAQAGIYTGIFFGLAQYIMNHYIFAAACQKMLVDTMREVETRLAASGLGQDEIDHQLAFARKLSDSPMVQLGGPILSYGIVGTALGLVAGGIFRRDPPEFAESAN